MAHSDDRWTGQRLRDHQSPDHGLPSRPVVGALVLAALVGLLMVDHAESRPINPFAAPPPVALGSGQAPQGAHCTDL